MYERVFNPYILTGFTKNGSKTLNAHNVTKYIMRAPFITSNMFTIYFNIFLTSE